MVLARDPDIEHDQESESLPSPRESYDESHIT